MNAAYIAERVHPGWQLRHQPTGLKEWLGLDEPSNDQIIAAYERLAPRVAEAEALE